MEERSCTTCKYRGVPPIGDPCKGCMTLERWEPKFIPAEPPFPVAGFDPGAPEGDTTNTRLDWGETGREMIGPKVGIDDDERGPVLAVTRMPLETVIGYAIDGIKDHASKIGLLLTDKTLGEHELFDLIHELANLHERWVKLETEQAEIQKAVEHVKNPDA